MGHSRCEVMASPPCDSTAEPMHSDEVVLVPVKAFREAKQRLAPVLSPLERVTLVRALATAVVQAATPQPVVVVCDDEDVAQWASQLDARVLWLPGRGLNAAVRQGVETLAAEGVTTVTVAHGDLAAPSALGSLQTSAEVTIVPDHRGDGTPVLRLPAGLGFEFSYGPGSFARHLRHAQLLDISVEVLRDHPLSVDIDVPSDLELLDLGRLLNS